MTERNPAVGYVLVNMFFAIIAKHFQKEDQAVVEERAAAADAASATPRRGVVEETKRALKNLLTMWSSTASKDPQD